MSTLMEVIEKRRSTRGFKPDPVPDEIIDKMLEAARLAPSGSNRQPQLIRPGSSLWPGVPERFYLTAFSILTFF